MNEFGEKARDFGEKLHYVSVRGDDFCRGMEFGIEKE